MRSRVLAALVVVAAWGFPASGWLNRNEQPSTVTFPSDHVLRRATEYVDRFERTFSAVIWRERYEQEVRHRRRFSSSGASFPTLLAHRVLDSELLFVWVASQGSWIAVRDVLTVDGKARLGDRRLPALLKNDEVTVDQLKWLAAANGQFNIGTIVRTFNEPTLALLFLDGQYRRRFTFTRRNDQSVDGAHAATYEFVETGRPTVIRDQERNLPVRGFIWIDPSTGQVLQTSLILTHEIRGLDGRMTVRYGPNPKFDVLVPMEMRTLYVALRRGGHHRRNLLGLPAVRSDGEVEVARLLYSNRSAVNGSIRSARRAGR